MKNNSPSTLTKNDIIPLEITALSSDGAGIARYTGIENGDGTISAADTGSMVVFVPGAAVGDRAQVRIVKVTKTHCFGRVEELTVPSPDRVTPDCPAYPQCGGCDLRHLTYERESSHKQEFVRDALQRIGGLQIPMEPIESGADRHWRNKAIFSVGMQEGRAVCGFFAARSHRVVPTPVCALHPPVFDEAVAVFTEFVHTYNLPVYDETSGKGLIRNLFLRRGERTGELMVMPVIAGRRLPYADELVARLRQALGDKGLVSVMINVNRQDTNLVLGKTCLLLWGHEWIEDELCGLRLRISPHSFYQVNTAMAERLYQKAAEYAAPEGGTLLDLYCGIGSIGLSMASRAEAIVGVEVTQRAVADAQENAASNGIKNARFVCGDAVEAAARLADEGVQPEVVLVDPPRKGLDQALIETICGNYHPSRVVYISCDAGTLARDCARFAALGYAAEKAATFDLFPRTRHVETVVLFERKNSD